jgi:hypothetical protein
MHIPNNANCGACQFFTGEECDGGPNEGSAVSGCDSACDWFMSIYDECIDCVLQCPNGCPLDAKETP